MKKWIIIITLLLMGIFYWVFTSHHQSNKPLKTITVKTNSITETATAVGDIEPQQTSTIKSQVAGIVSHFFHHEGDYVHKGDKLITIQPAPAPTTIATDENKVNQDKINLQNAASTLRNYENLLEHHIIASNYSELLTAQKTTHLAKAQLKFDTQIQQLNEVGKTQISGKSVQTTVVSPIDGYILQNLTTIGDNINSTQDQQAATKLFVLANMKTLYFNGSIDELDAGKIKPNMPAKITIAAYPNTTFPGKVNLISLQSQKLDKLNNNLTSTASDTTSTFNNGYRIKINFKTHNKNIEFRSGYSATATITLKEIKKIITIPLRLLVYKNNKTYVKIPRDTFTSKLQVVTTGINDGVNVQIKSGLKLGDKVVSG